MLCRPRAAPAAAREEQNIAVLRQSGADVVIPTAEAAGRLLGMSIMSSAAGGVIEDLLQPVVGLQIVVITAADQARSGPGTRRDRNRAT